MYELLTRRPLPTDQSDFRPKPSTRPFLPSDLFCSDSDSYASEIAISPSPAPSPDRPDEKPKPSVAPHLRLPADDIQPNEESLIMPTMDFGHQIDFEFCKHVMQDFASSLGPSEQSLGPRTRACAKLLVRSGLRCSFCFRLKSECLCLETRPKRHPHLPLSLQCVDQVPLLAYHGTGLSLPSR